jgi:flagellar protein FliJ
MRRFDFNLQRLLDYRRTVEDALLAELAGIRAEHVRERGRHLEMIQERDTFSRRIKKSLSDGDPEYIRRAYSYQQELSRQISTQEDRVRRLAEKKDQKTSEVIEASKERKSLDRLREHKEDEHRREAQRLDQEFLDDIGSIKSRRRGCGVGEAA